MKPPSSCSRTKLQWQRKSQLVPHRLGQGGGGGGVHVSVGKHDSHQLSPVSLHIPILQRLKTFSSPRVNNTESLLLIQGLQWTLMDVFGWVFLIQCLSGPIQHFLLSGVWTLISERQWLPSVCILCAPSVLGYIMQRTKLCLVRTMLKAVYHPACLSSCTLLTICCHHSLFAITDMS